ncbi:MAG: hypothetical protein KBT27_08135 [Prevotellaceae bacterium]|nr:hypothetical protein [Candidatus Faecinaster equi]
MTHIEWQEYEESFVVMPILNKLGLSCDAISTERDKPDIQITLNDKKLIGLEVTQYVVTRNKETQEVLYKLFKEYSETHLPGITSATYQIFVMFLGIDFPTGVNIKLHKDEIFGEIDSFLPGRERVNVTKYIEEATFYPSPNIPNYTSEVVALVNIEVNEKYLLSRIREKENKLVSYKQNPKNKNVSEYWLAINVAFEENTDFRTYQLPDSFVSDYSRIYLVKSGFCKMIYPQT